MPLFGSFFGKKRNIVRIPPATPGPHGAGGHPPAASGNRPPSPRPAGLAPPRLKPLTLAGKAPHFGEVQKLHEQFLELRRTALEERMRTADPSEKAGLDRDYKSLTIRERIERAAIHEGMPREDIMRVLQRGLQELRANPVISEAKRQEYGERIQKLVNMISKEGGQ